MRPDRWSQVDRLFQAALALDPADRAAFLDSACKEDVALRREIESLIASHDSAGSFISSPAIEANPSLIAGDTAGSMLQRQVGPYLIVSQIGSGGMGEVFLARDARLGRKVALKLLPDYFTRDEQRVRRFQQEARAASALNHPNIITIHDIGEVEGRHFIAMEYIDGETLREKIHRDKVPLDKLLKYLQQVAEGLTKAHAAGIIHRDLKPDNVMVTRDGYAKVLDFGLAKLIEQPKPTGVIGVNSSEAGTELMAQHSLPGMVMGTAGYMSPEQAQGRAKEIDHRSDIFSFGCMLYEAATGQRAFEGKDALDSLHNIVNGPTPRVKAVNPDAPDDLERIVRRCLAKDPEKRYHSIKDVAIELEELQQEYRTIQPEVRNEARAGDNAQSATGTQTSAAIVTGPAEVRQTSSAEYLVGEIKRHRLGVTIALTALVLVIAGVALLLYKFVGQNRTKSAVPFQIGKADRLTHTGKALDAAISPDGKFVVYVLSEAGQESLWARDVATNSNVQIVPPAEMRYRGMTFSPDGNYVYYVKVERNLPFVVGGVVYQVPKLGGATRKVLADVSSPVTFSPDGKRLAFVRSSPDEDVLMLANADGTGEQKLAVLKSPESFSGGVRGGAAVPGGGPAWSPDGKVIACPARIKDARSRMVVEVRVADGTVKPIGAQGWGSIQRIEWLRDGTGLIMCADQLGSSGQNTQIWHLAYPSGEGQMITHDLNQYGDVSLTADSSTLVSVQIEMLSNVWVAGFNQATTNASQITNSKLDGYAGVSWTPEGKIVYAARKIKYADLWMMDADGGNQKQLMDDQPTDRFPSVTPDGRYIVFDRGGGIWRMDADGGNIKQLTERGVTPYCSSDGKWVTYQQEPGPFVWKVSIDGGQPVRLTDKLTSRPAFSPDGKQIACLYREERTSPWKIAIFPSEGGQPIKVFDNPITGRLFFVLRWASDGRSILYVDERGGVGNIWSQPVDGGRPAQVTDFKSDLIYTFDLSRDGKWLAVTRGTVSGDVVMMSTLRQ